MFTFQREKVGKTVVKAELALKPAAKEPAEYIPAVDDKRKVVVIVVIVVFNVRTLKEGLSIRRSICEVRRITNL